MWFSGSVVRLWEHLSTHKDLYLSTEEENGGEEGLRAKEGEDVERESPSSSDDSDSAEEPLPLEDQQVGILFKKPVSKSIHVQNNPHLRRGVPIVNARCLLLTQQFGYNCAEQISRRDWSES